MKLKFGMKDVFTVLMTISIILLCILAGLRRIYLSDFIPINGDFQSYNGFRRLLSGQIPFKDFYFYLGLGPLYLNSFFLLLFGDNFTHSLFCYKLCYGVCFFNCHILNFKIKSY